MIRLGARHDNMRDMDQEEIFISRLKLIIIMTKAYLDNYPLGGFRREAMYTNACLVEEALAGFTEFLPTPPLHNDTSGTVECEFVLFQRIKLLTVMIKSAAKGFALGGHRRAAMLENVDAITRAFSIHPPMDMSIFKVA